jgi:hypothetical protein
MAVEVRQMVVKANVIQRQESEEKGAPPLSWQDKRSILEECRQLILEVLREAKER